MVSYLKLVTSVILSSPVLIVLPRKSTPKWISSVCQVIGLGKLLVFSFCIIHCHRLLTLAVLISMIIKFHTIINSVNQSFAASLEWFG